MAREGILLQHALHQHSKPIDALAHIDEAEGEVNLHAPRKQRHDACSSVGGIASVISTATNSGAACVNSSFQRNKKRAAISRARRLLDDTAFIRLAKRPPLPCTGRRH